MKIRKWFQDYWPIIALILLAVAMFIDPVRFQNLAWYGLVALTAVYAGATMRIARENRRTIEEMQQSRLDAVKPYLSLQPGDFSLGGSFGGLYLVNSGGTAKDVKIDMEMTNPKSTRLLFAPAIERDHWIYLGPTTHAHDQTAVIAVHLQFKDGYNHAQNDSLSIDLADLRKEGRELRGRYSELVQIKHALESLTSEIRHRNK